MCLTFSADFHNKLICQKVNWLIFTGCLETTFEPMALALRIFGISVLCAMVELLPVGDDNYTVPLSAAVLTALLLH